jgi:hypothetical protein
MPPLLEHLDSLLSGTGRELDLRTFKLVDQLSGSTAGSARRHHDAGRPHRRAPAQPRGRDAAVLLRSGAAHAPAGPYATREPLQFGAEIFGHNGLEADLEAQELALDCLRVAGAERLVIDLADARVLRGVLAGVPLDASRLQEVAAALSNKDAAGVDGLMHGAPEAARQGLQTLLAPVRRHRGAGARPRAVAAAAAGAARARRTGVAGGAPERGRPGPACRLRPVGHGRLRLLHGPALRASTAKAPPTRWRAAGATTKSAPCSAATVRQWASASTCGRWSRWCRPPHRRLPSAPLGARTPPCARRCAGCATTARSSLRCCRAARSNAPPSRCDRELVPVDGRWVLRALPAAACRPSTS